MDFEKQSRGKLESLEIKDVLTQFYRGFSIKGPELKLFSLLSEKRLD